MNDSPSQKPKPRRWRIVLLVLIMICIAIGVGLWLSINGRAKTELNTQISNLGLGQPEIGEVRTSTGGIVARNLKFAADEAAGIPEITVDRMVINHSLTGLIAGATEFDSIELEGVRIRLPLVNLNAAETETNFDLSSLKLPAKKIELKESSLTLFSPDQPDFVVDGINLTVSPNDGGIEISGQVHNFAGSQWEVMGQLDADNSGAPTQLSLRSDSFKIANGQWQTLPLIPQGFEKWIRGDGEADVNIKVEMDEQQSISFSGDATVKRLELMLPAFDLPIEISGGELQFSKDLMQFENILASTDGIDRLKVAGSTKIGSFPVVIEFTSAFEEFSTDSLRKLVAELPEPLAARTRGTATGTVEIAADTSTKIRVQSVAIAEMAAYGELQSDQAEITTHIDLLEFDENQNFVHVAGEVVTKASFQPQPLKHIFNTFELESLDQQLQMQGEVVGSSTINIPLATADQIQTWKLDFTGELPSATISGQQLAGVRFRGGLSGIDLVFESIRGVPISDGIQLNPNRNAPNEVAFLDVGVRWPLVIQPGQSDTASVALNSQRVPSEWFAKFIARQQSNAKMPLPAEVESIVTALGGTVNFEGQLQLPSLQPDDLKQWILAGAISNSEVSWENLAIRELTTAIGIEEGVLKLNDIVGKTEGDGVVSGSALLDLFSSEHQSVILAATNLPADWLSRRLIEQATKVDPIRRKRMTEQISELDLEGNLDLDVNYGRTPEQPAPTATIEVRSEVIQINQLPLTQVQLSANYSNNELQVKQLTASLPDEDQQDAQLEVIGRWNLQTNIASGKFDWRSISNSLLTRRGLDAGGGGLNAIGGSSNGSLVFSWNAAPTATDRTEKSKLSPTENGLPLDIKGNIQLANFAVGSVRLKDIVFDVVTRDQNIHLENVQGDSVFSELNLTARVTLAPEVPFEIAGEFSDQRLSQWLRRPSVTERAKRTSEITGVADGRLKLDGQLFPLKWQTSGNIDARSLRVNDQKLADIHAQWTHVGDDWKKSAAVIEGFGGRIEVVELTNEPERIRVKLENIDSRQMTSMMAIPVELTGRLHGEASLNEWSLSETRWADMTLQGSSILVGQAEFGDFQATAEFRNQKLNYDLSGSLLAGKLKGSGTTQIQPDGVVPTQFPLTVELRDASLDRFYGSSNRFRSLRPLEGMVSANAKLVLSSDGTFLADGRAAVDELKWNKNLLTRAASIHFAIAENQLFLDDVRADLKSGSILAKASVPLDGKSAGSYELDIRRLDLIRLSEIFSYRDLDLAGQLDARIDGQLGSHISGQGYVGLQQAQIGAVSGQSLRLPIQFRFDPLPSSGRIELRRSTFRIFDGNASGQATVNFGSRLSLNMDLKFSEVDTGKLFAALADVDQADQGKLNGRLILKGNGIRSSNDLSGTFKGKFERTPALQFPVLSDLTRFLAGNGLGNQNYDSDEIQLELNRGRVEVKQLNFYNSLAKIAVTGDAFLDGRLNLGVVARVDQLNQPTILDELVGNPLNSLSASPVSFFVRATEFLSNRVVFLKVGGTFDRPQVRLDSSQQIREETIRYFLRGSQILPNQSGANN